MTDNDELHKLEMETRGVVCNCPICNPEATDVCPACGMDFESGTFKHCGTSMMRELIQLRSDYKRLQKGFRLTCLLLGLSIILGALL